MPTPNPNDPESSAHHLAVQRRNKAMPPRRQTASVQSALKESLKEIGLVSRLKFRTLHQAWAAALAATPEDLAHTRLVRSRAGIITIEVDSSPRLNEFIRYRQRDLLLALNGVLRGRPAIIGLEFVLGHFPPRDLPPDPNEPIP